MSAGLRWLRPRLCGVRADRQGVGRRLVGFGGVDLYAVPPVSGGLSQVGAVGEIEQDGLCGAVDGHQAGRFRSRRGEYPWPTRHGLLPYVAAMYLASVDDRAPGGTPQPKSCSTAATRRLAGIGMGRRSADRVVAGTLVAHLRNLSGD